ncbi:MAG: DUF3857 domain-containing protein [Candidatus Wallbacteria bacterium]
MKESKTDMKIRYAVILLFLFLFTSLKDANSMSVTLKDGKNYKAEAAENETCVKILKGDSSEVISLGDVKSIDFSDETSENKVNKETGATAAVQIPADVKEILSKVPDKSKFPNAGGYVIEDEDTYTLNNDGTYKIESHYIFKIFEDRAVDNNISLGYAFERESIKIIMARSIAEDGTVANLDLKDVKEGEAYRGAQFFSNTYKNITATIPNVKKGSIIEYKIEHNVFKPIIDGYFCPGIYFISGEPKLHTKTVIKAPKTKKLYYAAKNFDRFYDKAFEILKPLEKPQIKEEGNQIIYTFEANNVPELISEENSPNYKEIVPRIQFSAYENWDKIYEWFNDKFDKFVAESSPEIKKQVQELIKDCKTNDEKVANIYHWIQQQNRYISIKGDIISGLSGHPAKRTFDNKYGDCVDKAILMAAMLNEAGIKAYPTLLNAGGGTWDLDVPHLYTNHSISFLTYDSKEIFLDCTSQDSRFPFFRSDDHDRNIMIPQLKKHVRAGMPVSEVKIYRDVIIKKDGGMSVKGKKEVTGIYESSIRSRNKRLKEEKIKEMIKQGLNGTMPGVELKNLKYTDVMDLSKPVIEEIEYTAPNVAIVADDLILFSVPGYSFNFAEISLNERKFPIDYDILTRAENIYTFEIPEGYKVKYMPAKFEIKNKTIDFRAEYKEIAPNKINFNDRFEIIARMVDPADYQAYKADLEKIMKYAGEKVVIEKK